MLEPRQVLESFARLQQVMGFVRARQSCRLLCFGSRQDAENRWLLSRLNAERLDGKHEERRERRETYERSAWFLRHPLGCTVVRRALSREKLYLVYVTAQEAARRECRGSGTKQGTASDPTTRTPDCTKATSSSALASLRDFSNAARRRRRRSDAPVEVIDLPYKLRLGVDEASAGAAHQRERLSPWFCGPGPRAVAGRRCPFEALPGKRRC